MAVNDIVSSTGERLKQIMRERQLTQTDLVKLCQPLAKKRGIILDNSNISAYVLNKYKPAQKKLALLSDALDVSLAWLMGADVPQKEEHVSLPSGITPISEMEHHYVPLIGSVAAGEPIYEPEDYGVYIDAPDKADYALRVSGDSMTPMFLDGDVIYVRAQDDVDDSVVGVVLEDDSYCVKHIYHNRNGLLLVSENSKYPPRTVIASEDNPVRILGKVCGYTRMFK